jgi:predicted TIM-barrel fold metal-dependent hydrolase
MRTASHSRRTFLKAGAFGRFAFGQNTGSSMDNYIDAHVHVWTDDLKKYPLAPGFAQADMKPRRFLPEDILRLGRPSGMTRIALVQMSYYGFDNSYMLDAIRRRPDTFRGIAVIDSNDKDPAAKMLELKPHGVRGFRLTPRPGEGSSWLDTKGYDEMFRCGAQEHLAMCPLIDPNLLPSVDRICSRFPETTVVVDHLGRIGLHATREEDIKNLCGLSRHRHVKVKVSAFYGLGAKKPPHLDLAPLIRRVFDAYGPQRLMWGSDCPFQVDSETYEDSIALIRDRLDFLTSHDKEWLLRRTAEETFFR